MSSVTNNPGSMTTISTGSVAWANPNNAKVLDGNYAVIAPQGNTAQSDFLVAYNFGFNIPSGATITGILVGVSWQQGMSMGLDRYASLRLANGDLGNANRAVGSTPPMTLGIINYGASDDLWGETLTPAIVNNSNFGFGLSVQNECGMYDLNVDEITMQVFYTAPSNTPPSCSITQDSVAHGLVTVTPTASDSDGSVTSLVITWGDGATTSGCTSGQSYQHTFASNGQKTIYATATDNNGASTESNHLTPTITLNVAPTAAVSVSSIVHRTVTVSVSGQDSDGSIASSVIAWGSGQGTTSLSSGERATIQGGGSVSKSKTYPATGGSFTITVTNTDDDGASTASSGASAVVSANSAPTASFTHQLSTSDYLSVTLNANASSDTDGSIASWRFDPGDGSGWHAGTLGQASVYAYATHGSYTLTVEVTDNEGATNSAEATIDATLPPAPSGDWSAEILTAAHLLTANAAGISAPEGETITDYHWDWGDETTAGSGVLALHRYAAPGGYTVTLTVTLSDDSTHQFTKEISMSTITKVTPKMETRAGGAITIAGTGFGASQSTGTVTAGGKALTSVTWGDTSISGKLAADCPYGSQDVVVTPAGGTAVTAQLAVFCYNAALQSDADEAIFGKLKKVYLDGVHVGFTSGGGSFKVTRDKKQLIPDDGYEAVKSRTFIKDRTLDITFAQLNGAMFATLLNGSYDDVAKVISLAADTVCGEHSLALECEDGMYMIYKRCVQQGDTVIDLKDDYVKVPTQWDVLRLDDPAQQPVEIYLP